VKTRVKISISVYGSLSYDFKNRPPGHNFSMKFSYLTGIVFIIVTILFKLNLKTTLFLLVTTKMYP